MNFMMASKFILVLLFIFIVSQPSDSNIVILTNNGTQVELASTEIIYMGKPVLLKINVCYGS